MARNTFISMKIYHPPCTVDEKEKGFGIAYAGVNPDGTVYISTKKEGFAFYAFRDGKLIMHDDNPIIVSVITEIFRWYVLYY